MASLGNISSRVFGAKVKLPLRRGIVGLKAPRPLVIQRPWNPGKMLVLHSDGATVVVVKQGKINNGQSRVKAGMAESKEPKNKKRSIQGSEKDLRQKLKLAQKTIRELTAELDQTNQGLMALSMELENRVDQRTAELTEANIRLEQAVEAEKRAKAEIGDIAKFPKENPNPVLRVLRDLTVLYANQAALSQLSSWRIELGKPLSGKLHSLVDQTFSTGKSVTHEMKVGSKVYAFSFAPITGTNYLNIYGLDISARKAAEADLNREMAVKASMLRLGFAMVATTDIAQLANVFLEEAKGLTESKHGYVGVIDTDSKELVCYTFTQMMGKECRVSDADFRFMFPCGQDGAYPNLSGHCLNNKEAFFTNTPSGHPAYKGAAPKGHVPIKAYLAAPAISGGKLLGQIALANPAGDYEDHHLKVIETLANQWAIAIERFRAQESLLSEKEQAQTYLDIAGAVLLAISARQEVILVNRAGCQLLGDEEENILGRNWFDHFIPEDERERVRSAFSALMTGEFKTVKDFENEVITSSGQRRLVAWHNTVIYDKQGSIVGTLSSGEDVTERRMAEEKLRRSEENYRLLFNQSETLISLYDSNGYCLMMNEKVATLFGGSPDHFIGKNISELHPAQAEEYTIRLNDVIASDEIRTYEDVVSFPAGQRMLLSNVYPMRDPQGKVYAAQIMSQDISERKQAEEALRESENKFRSITENAVDFIFIKDKDRRYTFVNQAMKALLGLPRDEILGKTPDELFGPEQGRIVKEVDDRAFDGETVNETRPLEIGGKQLFFNTIQTPLSWEEGQVASIMGIVRDVTEYKYAEESLRENQRKLAVLMGNLPGMAYHCRNQYGWPLDFASDGCFDLTGYSSSDLTSSGGVPYGDLINPEDRQRVWDRVQESVRSGEPFIIEYRIHDKQGRERWVWEHGLAIGKDHDGTALLEGFIYDITEGKRAEENLRRFEYIVSSSTDMIALIGRDYRYLAANEAYLTAFDKSETELIGHSVAEVFGDGFFNKVVKSHADRCMAEEEVRYSSWMDLPTWGRRFLDVTYSPYVGPEGKVDGFVVFARDRSQRKLIEEELDRYRQKLELLVAERTGELEAVNKELEAFAYSVSHDLRAPLRALDGFSQALLEDYQDRLDHEGRNYLQRIRAASQRMGGLIDDLLKLSRVTRSEINFELVDLSRMADRILNRLQKEAPERNAEFVISPGMEAMGDETLLEVLLENLLSNAWKFTSKQPAARIEFGVSQPTRKAPAGQSPDKAFFVKDNGAGFNPKYMNKLFQPFQRLHTMEEFSGTGIGLATVQRVVNRHGGTAWAESRENHGATFYFTLRSEAE